MQKVLSLISGTSSFWAAATEQIRVPKMPGRSCQLKAATPGGLLRLGPGHPPRVMLHSYSHS